MSETLISMQAHCPTCDGERACEVHGSVHKEWTWEDPRSLNWVSGEVDHFLLECRGCGTVFYLKDSCDSESVDYIARPDGGVDLEPEHFRQTFPSPEGQKKPHWIDAIGRRDAQLRSILDELYFSFDNQAYILASVGMRTALDRAIEVLGIDPAISFDEKLKALKDGGWVGDTEKGILDVIINAGSAAAHRGWSPNKDDAKKLLDAMEAFLHRAFIVGQDALSIQQNIPSRQRRR